MKILRYLLFPIVPIYYVVTWLRNKLFDFGFFKSSEYGVASICVGNLSVGGTGKTPMIEFLIRLLKDDFKIATLSRGYKRSSKGFIIADDSATADSLGDEPFQFYKKFEDIIVSVDADRRNGITNLLKLKNPPNLILLDDAFQHRKVKAKVNILLTSYDDLYVDDIMLPTGNLREPESGAKRADVIVVTKCPKTIDEDEKKGIIQSLNIEVYQHVFFSWIEYSDFMINSSETKDLHVLSEKNFTLVTGIANPKPMVDFLKSKNLKFDHLNFSDHHNFMVSEIADLKSKGMILTTEKDFMRLSPHFENTDKLFYLPIKVELDKPAEFENLIKRKLIPKA